MQHSVWKAWQHKQRIQLGTAAITTAANVTRSVDDDVKVGVLLNIDAFTDL